MAPEAVDKIKNKIFPEVKAALYRKISGLPIEESVRNKMLEKIKNISFAGTDCSDRAPGLSEQLMPNAFYTNSNNRFTICKGLLKEGVSEFTMSSIVAHELSHSIDPCRISDIKDILKNSNREQAEAKYPIKGLISCLRSNKSIAAKSFNSDDLFKMSGFCSSDQVTEAFADWMASDITVDYIEKRYPNLTTTQWRHGVANTLRVWCYENHDHNDANEDNHPSLRNRINGLYASNPRIRNKMGCKEPSQYLYCDATDPDGMAKAISVLSSKQKVDSTKSEIRKAVK